MAEQTVAETETDAEDVSEAQGTEGAQEEEESLDSLLSQYEDDQGDQAASSESEQSGSASSEGQESEDPDIKAFIRQYQEDQKRKTLEETRRDFDETAKAVKGDLDIPDKVVRGWINETAQEDRRILNAWNRRHERPEEFQKLQRQLHRKFREEFGSLPDRKLTEDKEAVAAAVRGASTRGPEESDGIDHAKARRMSQTEYEAWVQGEIRKNG